MRIPSQQKWISLGLKAAGAAFSGTVIGYLKGIIPAPFALTDEMLTLIVGFILEEGWLIKQKMVQDFGEGMLLAGLSQLISGYVGGGGTMGIIKNQPKRTQDQMRQAAQQYNVGI